MTSSSPARGTHTRDTGAGSLELVYDRWGVRVYHGDCLDVLREMPDCSVHSVVTDPPAGIRFMNRAWDSDMGGRHSWVAWLSERMAEAFRVLKPGGHAVVWAMPRTSHWTAWALEDAGFEIRDCIAHLFGSGFPKSLDVGKAIDRARNDRADVLRVTTWLSGQAEARGITRREIDEHMGTSDMGGWWLSRLEHRCALPTWEQWLRLRVLLGFGDEMDAEVWRLNGRKGTPGEAWGQREVVGQRTFVQGGGTSLELRAGERREIQADVTISATDSARQWEGWGTALKPSAEHWWLCRKPLSGTAATVLQHGTGALNIDGCRVGRAGGDRTEYGRGNHLEHHGSVTMGRFAEVTPYEPHNAGRWPSNVVLTHSALLDPVTGEVIGDACADGCVEGCPVLELDRQSGITPSNARKNKGRGMGYHGANGDRGAWTAVDSGGASRFFPQFRWEAKAPTSERPRVNGKAHPTVKPRALMRWMTRLITPPGGTVLDLFAGTGTTGQACIMEGFQAILIENDPDSIPLIKARLDARPRDEAPREADDEPRDLLDLIDGESS